MLDLFQFYVEHEQPSPLVWMHNWCKDQIKEVFSCFLWKFMTMLFLFLQKNSWIITYTINYEGPSILIFYQFIIWYFIIIFKDIILVYFSYDFQSDHLLWAKSYPNIFRKRLPIWYWSQLVMKSSYQGLVLAQVAQ